MFNAANILEALKNYIRTRGGTSNAYNIAEAVNDLNSIPQGSGGGAMFVTVVFDNDHVGTADKALSELVTAYESGMNVIATIEDFDSTLGKVTCTEYVDGVLNFGMPMRTDEGGWCLIPLTVFDNDGVDVWETALI